MKKMLKFTQSEYIEVSKRFKKYCLSAEQMEADIVQCGGNPEEVIESVKRGRDKFYHLYESDMTEKEIRQQLEQNMEQMDNYQKYSYLANVITAMTYVAGQEFENEEWKKQKEEYENISYAMKEGLLDMDSKIIQDDIEEMINLISEQVEQSSVLFIQNPCYEALQQVCKEEDMEKVQAVAMNTRENAVNMAVALYTLQKEGKLSSLENEEISPEDFGIFASYSLEIDAVVKDVAEQGSWVFAKNAIQKASKVVATLLFSSPVVGAIAGGVFLAGLFLKFAKVGVCVAGAIAVFNLYVHRKMIRQKLETRFHKKLRFVDATFGKLSEIYEKVRIWIDSIVIPSANSLWNRCYNFISTHIIKPISNWIRKRKTVVQEHTETSHQERLLIGVQMEETVEDIDEIYVE
ncbi:MAG: hypothetical protein IKJ01_00320 [Lachnospiraceae bacterium]|nr:hypothetical protein [Lachnospiraceae bacterium]